VKLIIRYQLFIKHFRSRVSHNAKLKQKFRKCLELFIDDERGYLLNNQPLIEIMREPQSFSVANDLRVVYLETDDYIEFLDTGTHN